MKKTVNNRLSRLVVLTGLSLLLFACGNSKSTSDCVDRSRISDGACTMEYDPVCGCDGKTYGNACQAEMAGLTSWEEGECNGL